MKCSAQGRNVSGSIVASYVGECPNIDLLAFSQEFAALTWRHHLSRAAANCVPYREILWGITAFEKKVNSDGNLAVPGNDEISTSVCWRLTNATRYEGRGSLDTSDIQNIEKVGWRGVKEFMKRVEDQSMNERERIAEARNLLVRVSSEGGSYLGFAPQVDGLWQGDRVGGIAAALLKGGDSRKPSRRQFFAFLSGFLPAYVTTTAPVRQMLETRRIAALARRYEAILQGTLR